MDSTLLSSRDGYPLEPKSGLNGVKPPVEFGERTRDCSLGHAGKEGPHLAPNTETLENVPRGLRHKAKSIFFFSVYAVQVVQMACLLVGSVLCYLLHGLWSQII